MAILTARSATCTKWRLKPSTATQIKGSQQRPWFNAMLLSAAWQKNRERKTKCRTAGGSWHVRSAPSAPTFSQQASIWYVAWWQTNVRNEPCVGEGCENELTRSSWKANEFICVPLPFKNTHPLWLIHSPKGCSEKLDCELNGRQKTLVRNDTCGSPYLLGFTNAPHSVGLFLFLPSHLPFLKSALTLILICLHLFYVQN